MGRDVEQEKYSDKVLLVSTYIMGMKEGGVGL